MDFPSTLPSPKIDGYQIAPMDATIRTDMDTGPARVRRRFTSTIDNVTASWFFTDAQMITFRSFVHASINDGSAWFGLNVSDGNQIGTAYRQARFLSPFSAVRVDNQGWKVDAKLEVR